MNGDATLSLGFAPLVSMRRLESLIGYNRSEIRRIADKAGSYYEPFDLRRGQTGKWRHIDNPKGELKKLQRRITSGILTSIPFDEHVLGGLHGKSIRDNLQLHVGSTLLVTLDIVQCFPSIKDRMVFSMFQRRFGCSAEIAGLLTKLTTFQYRLPQGSPCSSLIANLVLEPLHRKIALIAKAYDLEWSIYIDDIAISGHRARAAMAPIINAIQHEGFSVSHRNKKIKVMPQQESQELTGGVVNRQKSAGRKRLDQIREAIFALHARVGDISSAEIRSVRGKIAFVKSINATQGANLERVAARYLPEATFDEPSRSTSEWRPCTKFRRHRRSQQASA